MNILVTGASGFIGSFVVAEALRRDMQVWAGVRHSSSRQWLGQEGIRFLELDFEHPEALKATLDTFHRTSGTFDVIVHCAGVTKCKNPADFERVNRGHTVCLAKLLGELGMMPRQFIFLSTLSIFGPIREADFSEIRLDDTPQPNTAYGRSKLLAERDLQAMRDLPYVFLRPTGVYGPRERDYLMAMRAIARHVDFAAGRSRQDLTFVYVDDVVQAVFRVIDSGVTRRAYFLSDGEVYRTSDFSRIVRRELGNPFVLNFACPLWLLKLISSAAEKFCRHKVSPLNSDKYRIMAQRNWRCDIRPAVDEIGYRPQFNLDRGLKATVAWYKQQGWL